jgi:nucleoside-diphosphate-sugar epimerase
VAWAATTGRVLLKSLGTSWRPLVHIEDIAQAFVVAMRVPKKLVHSQAFNVGRTEENYRIREVAEMIRATVPHTRIEYAEDASPDRRNYRVNCDRIARTFLAYRPRWTVAEGIREVHQAITDARLSSRDFEGPRFNRTAHLCKLLKEGRVGSDLRWTHSTYSAAE